MIRSCVVGLLAFALGFVACVSESATAENKGELTAVTPEQAKAAVEDAQTSTNEVCEKAERELNKAKSELVRVETLQVQTKEIKTQADEAASKAEKMAPVNSKATAIVTNVKNVYNKVSQLYLNDIERLNNAVESFEKLLVEAITLKSQSNITVEQKDDLQNYYSATKSKAIDIKNQAVKLDADITAALTIMGEILSTEQNIKQSLKDAQLANLRVSVIVADDNIKSVMEDTGSIITNTQNKKEEVHGVVEQMKILTKPATSELNKYIKSLFTSADDELTKANGAVDSATQAMTEMTEQQKKAGEALTTIEKATDVSAAEAEVRKAEACVVTVQQSFFQLQIALQTAKNSVTKVNDLQQKLVEALTTTTSKPSGEQITATENAAPPVADGTDSNHKDETNQPTSKDLPEHIDHKAEDIKNKLTNIAQNVPTTALTGGKAPAPGAKNDSAMTVSVPLLVVLIASAVLQ